MNEKLNIQDRKLISADKDIINAVIPDGVTSIAESAFDSCTSLKSITIPNSVTEIGKSAFWDCTSLTSVTIPNGVTSIAESTFIGCTSLESITIPDSVTSIGEDAFAHCKLLTSVTIPNGVTSIGKSAFSGCTSLTNVSIPDSVTSIAESAFFECPSLTSATIPNGVTSIAESTFNGCTSLTNVSIPDSVTSIDSWAFNDTALYNNESNWEKGALYIDNCLISGKLSVYDNEKGKSIAITEVKGNYKIKSGTRLIAESAFNGCTLLTNVTIPDSVTSIGKWAFNECTLLKNITIPDSVTSIADFAFANCKSLTSITIPNGVTEIGGWAFNECTSLKSITIPDSVTSIDNSAFDRCKSLTSITIPDSVTEIGGWAFNECTSLKSITIPDSVTSIGKSAFTNTPLYNNKSNWENGVLYIDNCLISGQSSVYDVEKGKSIAITEVKGDYKIKSGTRLIAESAFNGCTLLTNVTIPDSVTSIGNWAFNECTSLESITIPDGVTEIGGLAFNGCKSLTNVIIPDSVTEIGGHAFVNCTSLKSITIPDSVKEIDKEVFAGCTSLTIHCTPGSAAERYALNNDIAVEPINTMKKETLIMNKKLNIQNGKLISAAEDIINAVIPDGVTEINNHAFARCKSLTSITIPSSVTYIGDYAFEDCRSLTSVTIPNSVTSIGDYAFEDCESLTSVTIPDSVTEIGYGAFFGGCKSLTIHCNPGSAAERYARNNIAVEPIDTMNEKLNIQDRKLISADKDIINAVIPDGVTSIAESAFDSCTSLKSITIPNSVTEIGKSAFWDCTSLTNVTIPDSVTEIGKWAFNHCTSLTNVTIPDSVTEIGGRAFLGCTSLKNITIPDSVTSIGESAFANCTSLTIHCTPGSAAERYALNNNIAVKPINPKQVFQKTIEIKSLSADEQPSKLDEIRAKIKNMRAEKISQSEIVDYVKTQSEQYKPTVQEYRDMLDFRAKFYNYSVGNNAMIYMQNPNSSYVGSYGHFKELGFPVKKGEKGMIIKVPKPVTLALIHDEWQNVTRLSAAQREDVKNGKYEVRQRTYFGTGYVYDISQTMVSQEQLPELLRSMSPKINSEDYYDALLETVQEHGISVAEQDLKSITLSGYYKPGDESITINSQLPQAEKLNTLAHEFSHALLHHNNTEDKLSTAQIEFEAESSAYISLKQAGFDMSDYKFSYTASHLKSMSPDELQKAMKRIDKCSKYVCENLSAKLGIDLNRRQIAHENDSLSCRHVSVGHCANQDNTDGEAAHHAIHKAPPIMR